MDITENQFIDLCNLLGCDNCGTIRGIGSKNAVELIMNHKDIETVLENIDQKKMTEEPFGISFSRDPVTGVWGDPKKDGFRVILMENRSNVLRPEKPFGICFSRDPVTGVWDTKKDGFRIKLMDTPFVVDSVLSSSSAIPTPIGSKSSDVEKID